MSELRVLHVIAEMRTGGAEALVAELARGGESRGWTTAVASAGGHRADSLREQGFEQYHVPLVGRSAGGLVRARRAVSRAVKDFRPDVIVAHNVSATAASCRLPLFPPVVPLVTVLHGVVDEDYPNAARVLRLCARTVIAVTPAVADRLCTAGFPRSRVSVIPNSVTAGELPDRHEARTQLALPEDVPVALCLARLEPVKRHDVLIDAWQLLPESAVLLIAGDGSARADLERRGATAIEQGSIRFLGNRDDVPVLLSASDVTVLTSDSEGLPIAVLESLAAGRPVVATDVGGLRGVLENGGGRLVPPRDPTRVARALAELLFDAEARGTESAAGLALVEASHHPEDMCAAYDQVLCSRTRAGVDSSSRRTSRTS